MIGRRDQNGIDLLELANLFVIIGYDQISGRAIFFSNRLASTLASHERSFSPWVITIVAIVDIANADDADVGIPK